MTHYQMPYTTIGLFMSRPFKTKCYIKKKVEKGIQTKPFTAEFVPEPKHISVRNFIKISPKLRSIG